MLTHIKKYIFFFITCLLNIPVQAAQPVPLRHYERSLDTMNKKAFHLFDAIETYLSRPEYKKSYLLAIKKRLENHRISKKPLNESKSTFHEILFTYLLEHSPKFAKSITESVCFNIENMTEEHLANSFTTFKMCMYDTTTYSEYMRHWYKNKDEVLQTIIECLTGIKNAVEKNMPISTRWHQKNAVEEFERIKNLLEECKILQEQDRVLKTIMNVETIMDCD